ncbi:hypothetical protein Emed_006707 [Eimeria media]
MEIAPSAHVTAVAAAEDMPTTNAGVLGCSSSPSSSRKSSSSRSSGRRNSSISFYGLGCKRSAGASSTAAA